MGNLKERILKEMVETPEDQMVRELRGCNGFNEDYIRMRCKQVFALK